MFFGIPHQFVEADVPYWTQDHLVGIVMLVHIGFRHLFIKCLYGFFVAKNVSAYGMPVVD